MFSRSLRSNVFWLLVILTPHSASDAFAKGRRPSWNAAAPGPVAEPVVEQVVGALRARGVEVATGRFGAHMHLALVNDGPVTLVLDV